MPLPQYSPHPEKPYLDDGDLTDSITVEVRYYLGLDGLTHGVVVYRKSQEMPINAVPLVLSNTRSVADSFAADLRKALAKAGLTVTFEDHR